MAGPRLAGKVAIVTGAGSRAEGIGNGRATAVVFAREGAREHHRLSLIHI